MTMSNEREATPAGSSRVATLEGLHAVYFIGIGGIGMSAIARYFHLRGIAVSGYDKTRTPLTDALQQEGIDVGFDESVAAIPKNADLVVYTPAVPADHAGLAYYRASGYKVVKRSDVLEAISRDTRNICVAGTHGKTTISTMIAHILHSSGHGCTAFLGGISVNYETNFWSSNAGVCVIEADEYDRSFLKLHPHVALISAMDADHLDVYGTEAAMQDAFVQFANSVRPGGLFLHKFGLKRMRDVSVAEKLSYSLQNEAADIFGANIRVETGGYRFDIHLKDAIIRDVSLRIGGMHNVENAIVAAGIAHALKIDEEKIRAAIASFKGVRRRFEYIISPKTVSRGAFIQPVLVDDYAHHPEELRALLSSARTLFPQRLVTVIFQPHLFTRTRDLAEGFAEVLSMADRVVLLPIYPARELPIEGVSSGMILERVQSPHKTLVAKEELAAWMEQYAGQINKEFGEVIIMAGAGDIDTLVQPVKQIIEKAS